MRRKSVKPYLYLIGALLLILSMPKSSSEKLRGITVAAFSPLWNPLQALRFYFRSPEKQEDELVQKLRLENRILASEVVRLKKILQQEEFLAGQLHYAEEVRPHQVHLDDLQQVLELQLESIPAQVIYRSAALWDNVFWINTGQKENEKLGREVVAVNSPVVVGNAAVGVIEYVGYRQSRVRLITDPSFNPSVRAVRKDGEVVWYLAKGELQGLHAVKWRNHRQLLRGVGFNYDFADEEGPARDLRTGQPQDSSYPAMPIIEIDDLLITSGLDGVFPRGLEIAKVSAITPLKEGDFYYEIEAVPAVENLHDVRFVYVIPPVGFSS